MEKQANREDLIKCLEEKYALLVVFARLRLKSQFSRSCALKGLDAEDIVQDAIKSVLGGRRIWDPQKVPDPVVFFKGVIRSVVAHRAAAPEYRKRYSPAQSDEASGFLENVADGQASAQDYLEAQEIWHEIAACVEGDDQAETVLLCIMEGYRRRDIIKETGFSEEQVDNILKKIRRRVSKIWESIEAQNV